MKLSPRTIAFLIAATVVLMVVFSSCVTINKTYLPQAKKDTVYLPCNMIHLQKTPSRQWPNWEYPLHTPGIIDTSIYWRGGGSIKIDTLKYLYDTVTIYKGFSSTDSVRVLRPKKGG